MWLDWVLLLLASFISLFVSFLYLEIYLSNSHQFKQDPKPRHFPSLSFIIPAYNEEASIAKTIQSIQSLDYPKKPFEIIVVDDGSKDQTVSIVKKIKGVKLIQMPKNSGRAAFAKNEGLKHATHEWIVTMDSDSYPEKNALYHLIGYLEDDNVAAVTASHLPFEPQTIWERIQLFEYATTNFFRKVNTFLKSMYVTPGPLSLFRKKAILEVGGFDTVALTEDIDMAFALIEKGHHVENSLNAQVYTEVPKTLDALFKQRMRWFRGGIMVTKKFWKLLFNPRYGDFGMFTFPFVFVISGILLAIFFTRALYLVGVTILGQLLNLYTVIRVEQLDWSIFFQPYLGLSFLLTKETVLLIPLLLFTLYFFSKCFSASNQSFKLKDVWVALVYLLYWGFLMSIWWLYALVLELAQKPRTWGR